MKRVLLCPPEHYGIEYEINPWMRRTRTVDYALARDQWKRLCETLESCGCMVELLQPQPGLPDMVFTANAGLVVGNRCFLSNFRYKERQGEALFYAQWFSDHGFEVVRLPQNLEFEGEGDALFLGKMLFCGYRFRSDIRSHTWLGNELRCLVISVELVDPRFYHLDTCFCPLSEDLAMWFPEAFDEYSRRAIRQHASNLIDVPPEEALRFVCNAVVLGDRVILPDGCPKTVKVLSERGFRCSELPMSEFIKAGGACKCLTLHLPQVPFVPPPL